MHARETQMEELTNDLAAVYASLQELNVPTWLRLDLPMAQFRALVVVSHEPGVTVGELGSRLSIGQSAASLLVDHLVRRGLIVRTEDPSDRRRSLLACAQAGAALLGELRHLSQRNLKGWLDRLSDEELEGVARGLRVLYQAACASVPSVEVMTTEATP